MHGVLCVHVFKFVFCYCNCGEYFLYSYIYHNINMYTWHLFLYLSFTCSYINIMRSCLTLTHTCTQAYKDMLNKYVGNNCNKIKSGWQREGGGSGWFYIILLCLLLQYLPYDDDDDVGVLHLLFFFFACTTSVCVCLFYIFIFAVGRHHCVILSCFSFMVSYFYNIFINFVSFYREINKKKSVTMFARLYAWNCFLFTSF